MPTDSLTADRQLCRDFRIQCDSFKSRMEKGRKLLMDGIHAAHAGWQDSGYENVLKMASAIAQDVESIEQMVSGQIIPYVDETISRLDSAPY